MTRYIGHSRWYREWDDTQNPLSFDGDDVLESIADDLMYHGDLHAALRRALREGIDTKDGRHIDGLREMLDRLRERREALQREIQPDGLMANVAEQLEEIVAMERNGLDQQVADAIAAGDEQRRDQASTKSAERNAQLDLLPSDPAGKIHELSSYPFSNPDAQQRFEELVEQLRHDLVQLQLDQAAQAMRNHDPAAMEHLRSGLDGLNSMIEQRAAGEDLDPSFEQFMEEYGDLFPGNPSSLDELLEQMAARMAATSQMMASMTPEQRAQLEELAAELMSDMDLAWQLDRLSENLRDAMPTLGWDRGFPSGQGGSFSLGQAGDAIGELAELNLMEEMLRSATEPGALAEIDFDAVEARLGLESRQSLEQLSQLSKQLEDQGHVDRSGGKLTLTPRGLRRLGQSALNELFAKLHKDRFGGHQLPVLGFGQDQTVDTKPYEFGDPFRLHIEQTVRNAIVRVAGEADDTEEASGNRPSNGSVISFPLSLVPDDSAITQTEHVATASTVLAVDLSLSMPMRDNFLAAKKVAVALQALIESRYPRDYLGLVGFSATARELKKNELPELSWDFAYGTNLQHALWLARRMLANRPGSKQIILITDGEPTAHVMEDGEVFFNYPPVPETLEATYAEVLRCTKERIVINAFVLDATPNLKAFIEQMTKRNHGRAFFTTPQTLGDYVLVDFVEHRRSSARRIRPA